MNTFEISDKLTFEDVNSILHEERKIHLSEKSAEKINSCRAYLDKEMSDKTMVVYGINTGFGSLCNTRISHDELQQLQENLLLSHACGCGDAVSPEIVRLMLLLKIQSLAFGHSGVQLQTVQRLVDFFNMGICPVVYEQGSLGASGDLAPLAHLCLPLIGRGEVRIHRNGKWENEGAEIIESEFLLAPLKLESKEGLALINGTQFMLAFGVHLILRARKLFDQVNLISCISLDAFDCRLEPFHPALHAIRSHKGQMETATIILRNLQGSELSTGNKEQVQDPYSFRCIPQVHGASKDTLDYTESVLLKEMNSVTDNPNIFPEENLILSGGNFHGQPLALCLDFMAIAFAELGSISERRTYQLISGQRGLPSFLSTNPGLNSGMMIPQYTAASLVSQNKQYCTPASVDSIVSSNGQEDHVSMGANAATKCLRVFKNLEQIISIELLTAAQALDFRRPKKSSPIVESFIHDFRKRVPFLEKDRELHVDMVKSREFLGERRLGD